MRTILSDLWLARACHPEAYSPKDLPVISRPDASRSTAQHDKPVGCECYRIKRWYLVGAEGTEHPSDSTGKLYVHQPGGAKSGADDKNALAELSELVALWSRLPAPFRKALIQLARSARPPAT